MSPPSYNPFRALQHFVALRSASRRILALEYPARAPRDCAAAAGEALLCCGSGRPAAKCGSDA